MTEVVDPTLPTLQFDFVVPDSPADLNMSACPAAGWADAGRHSLSPTALDRVWLAAARLESLQWEMDAARDDLSAVLRKAAACGAEPDALGKAAGMTQAELRAVLR